MILPSFNIQQICIDIEACLHHPEFKQNILNLIQKLWSLAFRTETNKTIETSISSCSNTEIASVWMSRCNYWKQACGPIDALCFSWHDASPYTDLAQ